MTRRSPALALLFSCRSQVYRLKRLSFLALLLVSFATAARAEVTRVVLVKCDGLPYEMVDQFVRERDPRTGKSQLPWIDFIFYQQGTRLSNFYVRGMSLSAPSWSLLETGRHLQIKGNVEFDRFTLHTYDYLNFFPYVFNASVGARVDMLGAEVLDTVGQPMLIDAFNHEERYLTFSLFQRGPRFVTFQKSLENKFKRAPRELFDEWTMGFGMRDAIPDQLIRETIQHLKDPKLKYIDLAMTDFDHAAHHNNDRESHLLALKKVDDVLGRIWSGIQETPQADKTLLIVVSDHGVNTDPRVYSQGYNLVRLLGSPEGGGHHVITKRRLLLDYAIKGINPFVPLITSTTRDSFYLQGQSTDYQTALLDFDGNERASIHLRDSDLNLLHILLQELQRRNLPAKVRAAATDLLFETINRRRAGWQKTVDELEEEMAALRRAIAKQDELWRAQPKKFSREEIIQGRDDEAKRVFAQLDRWTTQEKKYSEFLRVKRNLLALTRENFNPSRLKIHDLIARGSMGDRNNIYQLQNYVVGLAPEGLKLDEQGGIDVKQSFVRVNYLKLLADITVKNNVQAHISNRPVDFVATRIPTAELRTLTDEGLTEDTIWITGGENKQALILTRRDDQGRLSFRYLPIRGLTQTKDGRYHFETIPWQHNLPLRIFEDPKLNVPAGERAEWLSKWHAELEWFYALHQTTYSNGLIGLFEELGRHPTGKFDLDEAGISADERLMRRLTKRQRELIETDLLILANDHWNFDVRGFNPGGNHGSFLRISTHSTLMFAGGNKTEIPRGMVIEEPYDSLSFVPTVLALTGKLRDDNAPIQILWDKGFRRFPGRIIREIMPEQPIESKIATGAATGP